MTDLDIAIDAAFQIADAFQGDGQCVTERDHTRHLIADAFTAFAQALYNLRTDRDPS